MTITDKQVEAACRRIHACWTSVIYPDNHPWKIGQRSDMRAALEAAEAATWKPANQPPKGEPNIWTTPVAAMTLTGDVFRISYMHGADGDGLWQRTRAMAELGSGGRVQAWTEIPTSCEFSPAPSSAEQPAEFQARVQPWMQACFTPEICRDRHERNHRFLEEALELVQANGCTQSEAHQLVDYVFGRPAGELQQEVGGVMVTLAALCLACDIDMHAAGETELARIWTKIDAIRAKQAAKPPHSPLPAAPGAPEADERSRFEAFWKKRCVLRNQPDFRADTLRPERYFDGPTQAAWEGWQARAQSSAAPSVAPVSARDGEAVDLSELKDYTRDMVGRFFREFAATVLKAQQSYSDNGLDWRTHRIESLQRSFVWHCEKGEAMDVAVFAAALWARGAVVTPPADARDGGNWTNADDVRRLARELDVAWNGDDGAAAAPALCDVVAQIVRDLPLIMADLHQFRGILALRSEEADSVTILCDNPEGNPNCAIEVSAWWTEYNERRFSGDTLARCLGDANDARQAAERDRAMSATPAGAEGGGS